MSGAQSHDSSRSALVTVCSASTGINDLCKLVWFRRNLQELKSDTTSTCLHNAANTFCRIILLISICSRTIKEPQLFLTLEGISCYKNPAMFSYFIYRGFPFPHFPKFPTPTAWYFQSSDGVSFKCECEIYFSRSANG